MTVPGASANLRRLRQRFGISAPRLAIKAHVAWYWRALLGVVAISIALALAAWAFETGRSIAGTNRDELLQEVQSLRSHVIQMDSELTNLRGLAGSGDSSLQIERATHRQLSLQVKSLEVENATLKEDLAFFEGLMPASESGEEGSVRIDNLRITPGDVPGEYRYRLLVVNSAGRQAKEFKGALQLLVKVRRDGKDDMITLPSAAETAPQRFRFEIKYFHRLEGVFSIPPGAVVKDVEVRVLQDGNVRARQSSALEEGIHVWKNKGKLAQEQH
jgi:hypothetical protein